MSLPPPFGRTTSFAAFLVKAGRGGLSRKASRIQKWRYSEESSSENGTWVSYPYLYTTSLRSLAKMRGFCIR